MKLSGTPKIGNRVNISQISRQECESKSNELVAEYRDSVSMQSPLKKHAKSHKKRVKKAKAAEGQASGTKSLQRQTTFDMAHQHILTKDALKINSLDQKIDWLKLAKDERTIGGSKLLMQATELQQMHQPCRSTRKGGFSVQETYTMKQGQQPVVYQPPITQTEGAKVQYKSFKGVRKTTKSPMIIVRSSKNTSKHASLEHQDPR